MKTKAIALINLNLIFSFHPICQTKGPYHVQAYLFVSLIIVYKNQSWLLNYLVIHQYRLFNFVIGHCLSLSQKSDILYLFRFSYLSLQQCLIITLTFYSQDSLVHSLLSFLSFFNDHQSLLLLYLFTLYQRLYFHFLKTPSHQQSFPVSLLSCLAMPVCLQALSVFLQTKKIFLINF